MAYTFNPHRHVKIWLSKDPDTFLNMENQLRLVKMRGINPKDEITLVYESSLLSANALAELHAFCAKHNITPKDVTKDLLPHCKTDLERALAEKYRDEITHLSEGGNLAVGSDILR